MDLQNLQWKNLTYVFQKKERSLFRCKYRNEDVLVLDNVCGTIKPGTLTAVIGPSGAGKTTFISAVSQRIRGKVSGTIYLNDRVMPAGALKSYSAYIPQNDVSIGSLTPQEHMMFLAKLKIKSSNFECVKEQIAEILSSLGLTSCANTFILHLSGGEKRKLMLAGELLTNPQIMFCDEPTTGLDSYNASCVIRTLRHLAGVEGNIVKRAIVCSIHQPSSDLFDNFTHVILMQHGRIVFQGSLPEVQSAFSKAGLQCPQHFNPAEFYVKAVSIPLNSKYLKKLEKEERLKADFIQGCQKGFEDKHINHPVEKFLWFFHVFLLIKRNLKVMYRNLKQHAIQSCIYLSTSILVGLLYNGVVPNQQASIQDTSGAFFTVATEIIFTNIYFVVYLIPNEMPLLKREIGEGLYSLSAFYMAQIIFTVPKVFFETLLFLSILYGLTSASFSWTSIVFFQIFFSLFIGAFASMSYGFLLSGLFESIKLTLELAPPLDLILLMLSGIYINIRSFPYGKYISFFYFTNEAICVSYWSSINSIDCSKNQNYPCLRNGTEVLDSLGYGTTISTIYYDYFGLLLLAIIYHMFGYLGIRRLINKQADY